MKPLAKIFEEIEREVPRPYYAHVPPSASDLIALAEADSRYDWEITDTLCKILWEAGEEATIRRMDRRTAKVAPDELRSSKHSLRYGRFDCLDSHLRGMHDGWHGSRVSIPDAVARRTIRLAIARLRALTGEQVNNGGRPIHPGKAWYEAQGCERGGRTMKELQRQIEAATGQKAPAATTIRDWEKAFKSTETPYGNPS